MLIPSRTLHINSMIHGLIVTVLIITPIFSINESLALIFGGLVNNSTALTPPYIKAAKDLSFILLILIGFAGVLKSRNVNKTGFFVLLYVIFIILTAYLHKNNLIIFMAGIRWLVPIVLMIFLIPYINKNLLFKIAKLLGWLFVFHFVFQIIQLFFAGDWFGLNALGLSARNPGMFFIPSTSAFFTILVLFFAMFYLNNALLRKLILLLSPISIFLTASGSGIAVYILVMMIFLTKKKLFKLIPVLMFISFFIFIYTVEIITGRVGILEESFGTRIAIFLNIINDSKFLSHDLGYGTSTGDLIANQYGLDFNMISTDSTYAAIIVNSGILSFFLAVTIFLLALTMAFLNKNKEKFIFLLIFGLFSATLSILEAYPMNLLFAVLMAYYLKNYKKERFLEPPQHCRGLGKRPQQQREKNIIVTKSFNVKDNNRFFFF